jgi:hypothetical protein
VNRIFRSIALLLALEIACMSGCTTSTKEELELTTYDPMDDHQKIAAYYRLEAARFRQTAEELSMRVLLYEELFGPTSDWVTGARLLAQSYGHQAKQHEQKAHEHLQLLEEQGGGSHAQSNRQ